MENVNYIIQGGTKNRKEKRMIEMEKMKGTVEMPIREFDRLIIEAHIGRMVKSYIAAKGDYTDIPYAEVQVLKQLIGIKAEE